MYKGFRAWESCSKITFMTMHNDSFNRLNPCYNILASRIQKLTIHIDVLININVKNYNGCYFFLHMFHNVFCITD